MFSVLAFYCKRVYLVPKQVRILFVYLIGYISVLVAFMVFVIVNGSIVVGDKAAHEAAVHFPQVWNLWRLHIYQENIPNLMTLSALKDFLFQFILHVVRSIYCIHVHWSSYWNIAKTLDSGHTCHYLINGYNS